MPRIPDDDIERIKRETDLAALVRSRGIELNKHGNGHLIGICPFHEDSDPSFIVTPAKGLFHCMGCGAAGNAIQFLERYDGISFRHAYELLSEGAAAFSSPGNGSLKKSTIRRMEPPFGPTSSDGELLEAVMEYYHQRLQQSSTAQDYLKSRGLYDKEAIERFRLGFADRSLGLRLPQKRRQDGAELRKRLEKLGLYRASGHEHFNGSLVLPIFEYTGRACPESGRRVAEMYGRKVTRKLKAGTPKHLYLPGPHAGIWNPDALKEKDLILCEAPLDALTFWVNGLKKVTFIFGTEGFTDELFEAIIKHKIQTVRIAYDNDEAGNRVAKRDADRFQAHGIEVYRIKFPHGMDANEYANKVQPADKALAQAVLSAEWIPPSPRLRRAGGGVGRSQESGDRSQELGYRSQESEVGSQNGEREPPSFPHAGSSSLVAIAANSAADVEATGNRSGDPDTGGVGKEPSIQKSGDYDFLKLGSRHYRVGGLDKNNSLEVMKISLRVFHNDLFHVDSFDLLRDNERRRFIDRAAEETQLKKELLKRDLGKLLLALESAQEQRHHPTNEEQGTKNQELSEAAREAALVFLRAPNLIERIESTFEFCGLVGEVTNRLAAYLACTSRKLHRPLAVIIQSTSAAGKSTLMEAVLALFPKEEQAKYSAMTGQSLYYLGETNLKHKILAIVEEEGAEKASYALKLLQSEGELTIASTGKDAQSGRMETQEYHVEGPVMIFLTTTAIDIDEELQNRCLTLSVDESKEQTERIHQMQRKARTLEGLRLRKQKQQNLQLLQNVQRCLEPIPVVNHYAYDLTFTSERTRTRRDHEKYLGLIEAITLLHQYQRPIETDTIAGEHIATTIEDIELANRLAPELLARSLDELPPQTRRVFEICKEIVREKVEAEEIEQRLALFSRREVRERLGWGITQVRAHLERLRDMEYIDTRYGRLGSAFQYELLMDCREKDGVGHIGLLDVEQLRRKGVGKNGGMSKGCRPQPRHPQALDKPSLKGNLSTYPERTSGARKDGES